MATRQYHREQAEKLLATAASAPTDQLAIAVRAAAHALLAAVDVPEPVEAIPDVVTPA